MMNDCRLNLSDIDSHDQIIFTIMGPSLTWPDNSFSIGFINIIISAFNEPFDLDSPGPGGLLFTLNLNNVSVELQGGETAEYSSSIVLRDFDTHLLL